MTQESATEVARDASRLLGVKATVGRHSWCNWFVEVTLDGVPVVLRDGTDLVFLIAERRSQAQAA